MAEDRTPTDDDVFEDGLDALDRLDDFGAEFGYDDDGNGDQAGLDTSVESLDGIGYEREDATHGDEMGDQAGEIGDALDAGDSERGGGDRAHPPGDGEYDEDETPEASGSSKKVLIAGSVAGVFILAFMGYNLFAGGRGHPAAHHIPQNAGFVHPATPVSQVKPAKRSQPLPSSAVSPKRIASSLHTDRDSQSQSPAQGHRQAEVVKSPPASIVATPSTSAASRAEMQKWIAASAEKAFGPVKTFINRNLSAFGGQITSLSKGIDRISGQVSQNSREIGALLAGQRQAAKLRTKMEAEVGAIRSDQAGLIRQLNQREKAQKGAEKKSSGDSTGGAELPAVPAKYFKYLIGRRRLPDFNIIQASDNGKMSIVRTPLGEVNVYFKGERFHAMGTIMTTERVMDRGLLLLAKSAKGGQWFIDTKRVKVPERHHYRQVTSEHEHRERVSSQRGSAQPKVASGWTVNAVFGSGYLVKTPTGKFIKVSKGSEIGRLGKVKGMDSQGNLLAGNWVIERAK